MKNLVNKIFSFKEDLQFFFLEYKSLFFLSNNFGCLVFRLPAFFFFNKSLNKFQFTFINKFYFKSFLGHFFTCYKKLSLYFFFRIKLRGLGYRIRKLTKNLYRFFLGTTNFIFFHSPYNVLVKVRRRRMLVLSSNLSVLRTVFVNILLLKKLIPYKLRGVFFPKQIILLKPGKKRF